MGAQMLVSVNGEKGTSTMVTLLTEKLQDQSLSDLPCKAYSITLHSEKLSQSVSLFPYDLHEKSPCGVISRGCALETEVVAQNAAVPFPMCPFGGNVGEDPAGLQTCASTSVPPGGYAVGGPLALPGWISELNLNENGSPQLAPPTKRHCRSLSEPDELARCRSPWRPGSGSKIWTPISKRRCNSGGAASLQRCHSHGNAVPPQPASSSCSSSSSGCGHALALHAAALDVAVSPVPRPSSASSGFGDVVEGSTGFGDGEEGSSRFGDGAEGSSDASSSTTPWHSGGSQDHASRRRLSLSQEHMADMGGCMGSLLPSASSTPSSTPELCRRQGLLRCRSQPCVLQERKSSLKRRREEEVRWSRPSLDFLKMTRSHLSGSPGAMVEGVSQRNCPPPYLHSHHSLHPRQTPPLRLLYQTDCPFSLSSRFSPSWWNDLLHSVNTAESLVIFRKRPKKPPTLKNSKSLCSLDYEEDEDTHGQIMVSSPCESVDLLVGMGEEPAERAPVLLRLGSRPPCPKLQCLSAAAVSESDEDMDASDCESAEEALFPLDYADLDLEEIENN